MKQRDTVSMPAAEIAALLAAGRKLQLATINADGTPHLVSMFYGMRDGRIAFWTYRASQKARNLARDPRVTCLVEDGDDYFDLRGVQVTGVVTVIEDLAGVTAVGRLVAARMPGPTGGDLPAEALDDYVAHAAPKRAAYVVEPRRVISWDHRRLLG
ncbi:TIGR03618 family F420-dependent PPOX class oxidoreductase [Actinoplanes sp. HUAS TT8]|uniref:TIGR03618 family F420-dependent PPOX class oxidoreductase n=1 Tax=Actinoplanes sp. HUAS TT8 TaxID=3447453 RepID=UPI003F5283BE